MRGPGRLLSSLTPRGRGFVAAGLVLLLVGLAVGQTDVVRVAVFLLAAPLSALLLVSRTRVSFDVRRELRPTRVPAGEPARVQVSVHNRSRIPTGRLFFEDRLPYQLGGSPRFCVEAMGRSVSQSVAYTLRCDLRGRYRIGPLSVRISDPFGLCQLRREFPDLRDLLVLPAVRPLPAVSLGAEWAGEGARRTMRLAAQGDDDVTTRPYRLGDDLRRVHWRTTARLGELTVRREAQPWQARVLLLLDSRRVAHTGEGAGSSFEYAVSALASIGTHFDRRGFGLRALTDTGSSLHPPLLEALAGVQQSHGRTLSPGLAALRADGGENVAVLLLGRLFPDDVEALARCRHLVGEGVVVLLDTAGWAPAGAARAGAPAAAQAVGAWGPAEAPGRVLAKAGWQVLTASRDSDLAQVWARAGLGRRARTAAGSGR